MNNDLDFRKIGIRIQKHRIENNMTQEKLSELIDSSQKYLSAIESGKHRLSLDTIVAIAKALNVSVDCLVADYSDSADESNLHSILEEIRGMSPKQLDMLREVIALIKKYNIK